MYRKGVVLVRSCKVWEPVIAAAEVARTMQSMMIAAEKPHWDIGLVLTDNTTIQELNAAYRNKPTATDILSFPFHDALSPGVLPTPATVDEQNLGDLVISVPFVEDFCHHNKIGVQDRMTTLCAHGIAHLLGHDHETDEDFQLMQHVEEHIRACYPAFLEEVDDYTEAAVEVSAQPPQV